MKIHIDYAIKISQVVTRHLSIFKIWLQSRNVSFVHRKPLVPLHVSSPDIWGDTREKPVMLSSKEFKWAKILLMINTTVDLKRRLMELGAKNALNDCFDPFSQWWGGTRLMDADMKFTSTSFTLMCLLFVRIPFWFLNIKTHFNAVPDVVQFISSDLLFSNV